MRLSGGHQSPRCCSLDASGMPPCNLHHRPLNHVQEDRMIFALGSLCARRKHDFYFSPGRRHYRGWAG